jgi:hypothetical protein
MMKVMMALLLTSIALSNAAGHLLPVPSCLILFLTASINFFLYWQNSQTNLSLLLLVAGISCAIVGLMMSPLALQILLSLILFMIISLRERELLNR